MMKKLTLTIAVVAVALLTLSGPAAATTVTLQSDLAGWWKMGEGATGGSPTWTVPDDSANSNTATGDASRVAGVAFDPYDSPTSYAMDVPDLGGFKANHHSTIDFADEDFSVSLWFKGSSEGIVYKKLVQKLEDGEKFWQAQYGDGQLHWVINGTGGGLDDLGYTTTFASDTWRHLVLVRDAGNDLMKIYDQGNPAASQATTQLDLSNTGDLYIADDVGGNGWVGIYNDVRMYGVALTDANVTAIYNLGKGDFIPEPSSFVLAAMGLLGLAFAGRRKRQR